MEFNRKHLSCKQQEKNRNNIFVQKQKVKRYIKDKIRQHNNISKNQEDTISEQQPKAENNIKEDLNRYYQKDSKYFYNSKHEQKEQWTTPFGLTKTGNSASKLNVLAAQRNKNKKINTQICKNKTDI